MSLRELVLKVTKNTDIQVEVRTKAGNRFYLRNKEMTRDELLLDIAEHYPQVDGYEIIRVYTDLDVLVIEVQEE